MKRSRWVVLCQCVGLTLALGLSGCGLTVPKDPDGVMERIEGSVLRAGASLHERLVERDGDSATGPLAELVDDFASEHSADVEWRFGSEEALVVGLESGELDVVIGGISASTPWAERVGVTREFRAASFDDGKHPVLLVPMGQNRLLTELETLMDEQARA